MNKSSKTASVVPEGKTLESPQFAAEAFATVALEVLAKEYGPKAAKAVYDMITKGGVTFVRIYDSWAGDKCYFIRLGFENLLPHGVYLESIMTQTPDGLPLKLKSDEKSIRIGDDLGENSGFKPILLQPFGMSGASRRFLLQINDRNSILKSKGYVNLRCQWVRLDESINLDKEFRDFTVRLHDNK